MDTTKLRKRADLGLRKAIRYISPAAKVIGETTKLVATLAKPTPLAVAHAAMSGINTLSELLQVPDETPEWGWPTYISPGIWTKALLADGWRPQTLETKKGYFTKYHSGDDVVQIDPNGNLKFWEDPRPVVLPRLIKAVSKHVPMAVRLAPPERDGDSLHVSQIVLTDLVPAQTDAILARTMALLGERRAILLEGRPGVGKTTMAQALAKKSGLGRVLMLDNSFLSSQRSSDDALRMLAADVIIIDDIDKVRVTLPSFERMRGSCRLLICTANNGAHDSVIDGALARPARLDEIFTISGTAPFKRPPFDRLTPEMWDIVSQWPQAYLNELELRLLHTPNDLRLEDLEKRMERRTASVAGLVSLSGLSESPQKPMGVVLSEVANRHSFQESPDDDFPIGG